MSGTNTSDPYDLRRFVAAQESVYAQAIAEIKRGRKESHWMWFIFPQFAGLGFSSTSQHYAIQSLAEATAYLEHQILGPRLIECAKAAMELEGKSAREVFGTPDDLKLRSSATLFDAVSPEAIFAQLLRKYFQGQRDDQTLRLIGKA